MTTRAFSYWVPGALLPFALFAAHSAAAQGDLERGAARDAANSGRAAFDAGQYEQAIDSFSHAEQLVHAPPHLLFLARSQVKLGRLVAARETYLKITREVLTAKAPKAFVDAHTAAEQEQAALEARLPSVTVKVQGASASDVSLEMDGAALPAAMIGIPLPADPGKHVFKASSASAESEPVSITVVEASKQTVTLSLHPSAGRAPSAPPPTSSQASTTLNSSQVKGSGLRIASYVSFGVGAVGLGLGTVFLLKAHSTRNSADQLFASCNATSPAGKCADRTTQGQIDSKDNDADGQGTLAATSLIVGGAGLAAGIVFLVLDGHHAQESAQRNTPRIIPVVGLGSVGLLGSF